MDVIRLVLYLIAAYIIISIVIGIVGIIASCLMIRKENKECDDLIDGTKGKKGN